MISCCNFSGILNELDEGQTKQLLLKLVEREPGVVFDLMTNQGQCEVDLQTAVPVAIA